MPSIAIQRLCIAIAALSASAGARESNRPPQFVHDPVLGLRIPAASVKLDPMPETIRAMCEQMADNATWTGHQFIFGVVKNSTATYYLVNGYAKRRNPQPGERLYVQPVEGSVYTISGAQCGGDAARETFEVRDFKQIPREVLQQLARDLATRLVRAVGGAGRLRTEIINQRIDFQLLSPETQEAFKPYFDASSAPASARQSDSQFVHDPMLGVRLPVTNAKLEPLPEEIRAMCDEMADTETLTGRLWIFGMVKGPTATYYLVDGYSRLRSPQPGQRASFPFYDSGVYTVADGKCSADEASETVDVRDPKQIPRQVRQHLADDLATRLLHAAGGKDRLRDEIKKQRIDFGMLAPEVQQAFKPYFGPVD